MRKILSIIVCFIIAMSFTACGDVQQSNTLQVSEIIHRNFENNFNQLVVSDDEYIYMGNYLSVYKARKGTDDFAAIYTDDKSYIYKVVPGEDKIYFCTVDYLYSMDKDGNNLTELVKMCEDDGTVIWNNFYVYDGTVYLEKNDNSFVTADFDTNEVIFGSHVEKRYLNSRGMEYNYVMQNQRGNGYLLSENSHNKIPAEGHIINDRYFMITDNYVFYITGSTTDRSADLTLYRCDLYGSDTQTIKKFDKEIYLLSYDNKKLYYHDYNKFFIMNIESGEITDTGIEYSSRKNYEICNGKLYQVLTLNPKAWDLSTGFEIQLVFN